MGPLSARAESVIRQRAVCLMGVLNATPDSFFDGGRFDTRDASLARARELVESGADFVDVGGESTRPGSTPIDAAEQLRRIEPALQWLVQDGRAVVSVDTADPRVAERALELGAHVVNDVSCLRDPELARVTARAGAVLVLMHSREPMSDLVGFSSYPDDAYGDVVADVLREWRAARDRAVALGMAPENVWIDPGIGFAKNARQSFVLLGRLDELTHEGVPLVVGPSRKSFITAVDQAPPEERLGGTIAACLHAVAKGARVLRVHDVQPVRQALLVSRAAEGQAWEATDAR